MDTNTTRQKLTTQDAQIGDLVQIASIGGIGQRSQHGIMGRVIAATTKTLKVRIMGKDPRVQTFSRSSSRGWGQADAQIFHGYDVIVQVTRCA